jgi:hypothetical protein
MPYAAASNFIYLKTLSRKLQQDELSELERLSTRKEVLGLHSLHRTSSVKSSAILTNQFQKKQGYTASANVKSNLIR